MLTATWLGAEEIFIFLLPVYMLRCHYLSLLIQRYFLIKSNIYYQV